MSKAEPSFLPKIPGPLIEAIKAKRAIPFLGAGASREAKNTNGESPPDAEGLRDLLAEKFFGKAMPNRDVMAVAEMAIANSAGASLVYEYVRKIFEGYRPAEAHKLLAAFSWRTIATTNYDLLIEDGYATNGASLQSIVRFVKDDEPIESMMQEFSDPVQYLKLHGCLDHIHDSDIPLILSKEQYATYSKNRERLFGRLQDLAHESTIIFIGYRLDDAHIRALFYKLEPRQRPRWYIIAPDAEDYDIDFWSSKNVEVIKSTFGQFMAAIDAEIPQTWRALTGHGSNPEIPIRKFYRTTAVETAALRATLDNDITLVHSGIPYGELTPKQFYEGYDGDWAGIVRRFDVRRKVEDDLLFKVLLENENPTGPQLILLKGAAGAGKSIALKRTAFEAATASNALVFWLEETGALRPEAFFEIYELCKCTIYLFVDQVALHVEKITDLLRALKTRAIPLVLIGAERDADWNTYCGYMNDEFHPQILRVGNLSEAEVEGLLDLLERFSCLGLLRPFTRQQQVAAFMNEDRADRQLLVALHELTQGKPFEDIVFSEHQRIHPEQARDLYLDIATMHQFSVTMRAGTVSRVAGIDFREFEEKFFEPLNNVVRVDRDRYTGDWIYKTRHSRVAALVFRQVCPDDESKARQFKKIMAGLDAGYSSDRRALEEMTRGRALAEAFGRVEEPRTIYEAATAAAPRQAFLHQQWAIFEMNHPLGSLEAAEKHALAARQLDQKNGAIIHTQAEIDRRRANDEVSPILKDSLRRRVRTRLDEMRSNDRFATSSRCKLLVDEVSDLNGLLGDDPKAHDAIFFENKVRDAEEALLRAQQSFPEDADFILVEARLHDLLREHDSALRALERAWIAGPRGSGTAIRLARAYDTKGMKNDAHRILRESLSRDPEDKASNYAMALHLLTNDQIDGDIVEYHLRKSYASGDQSFEQRYTLAQFLFSVGRVTEAVDIFEQINSRAPAAFRAKAPREENVITARLPRFSGSIDTVKDHFIFIKSGAYPIDIFCHMSSIQVETMDSLSVRQPVNFRVRFNRAGPTAVDPAVGRAP